MIAAQLATVKGHEVLFVTVTMLRARVPSYETGAIKEEGLVDGWALKCVIIVYEYKYKNVLNKRTYK